MMDKNKAYQVLVEVTGSIEANRKTHDLIAAALMALKPADAPKKPEVKEEAKVETPVVANAEATKEPELEQPKIS